MGTGAALIGAAVIAAAGSWYATDTSRRTANEQADAAKEQAAQAAQQAKELAELQSLRDKTVQESSEEIGKLDIGEEETARVQRARGKALFKIDKARQDIDTRLQIGVTAPGQETTGVQI